MRPNLGTAKVFAAAVMELREQHRLAWEDARWAAGQVLMRQPGLDVPGAVAAALETLREYAAA